MKCGKDFRRNGGQLRVAGAGATRSCVDVVVQAMNGRNTIGKSEVAAACAHAVSREYQRCECSDRRVVSSTFDYY